MDKNITIIDILKSISVYMLLAIPPWMIFRKYAKERMNRYILVPIFLLYMIGTFFTEQYIPFILVIIILIFIKKDKENKEIKFYFRPLKKKKLEIILYSIIFMILAKIITVIFVLIMAQIFKFKPESQQIMNMFFNGSWAYVIYLSILTVIVAPILEEFIFRHVIYGGLAKRYGKLVGIIISSLLFTILHYNVAGALAFFAVGTFNCYLYEKYGYRAAVINHAIFNFSSTSMIIVFKALNIPLALLS